MSSSTDEQCVARTNRGRRCTMRHNLSVDQLCVWHDPRRKGRADVMRRKGGRASAQRRWERAKRPTPLRTIADVPTWTSWAADAVAAGDITPKHAQEITRACLAFLKAVQATDLAKDVGDLKAQLKVLRRAKGAPA